MGEFFCMLTSTKEHDGTELTSLDANEEHGIRKMWQNEEIKNYTKYSL